MKNLDNYHEPQEGTIMENPQISDETREKLEEATVSLFMDQYTKAMNAGFDVMMEECADHEFPPELEKRCLALIEREYTKERKIARKKSVLRVLRSAAIIAVALLSLSSVLFMTVEAFRVPIMNFFVEKHDRHLEVSGTDSDAVVPDSFDPNNPLASILPAGYTLTDVNNRWDEGMVTALYCDAAGSSVFFSVSPAENIALIDDEDATAHHFRLIDYDAYLLSEGGTIRLIWIDSNNERMFTICGTNLAEDTVLSLGEAIVLIFN